MASFFFDEALDVSGVMWPPIPFTSHFVWAEFALNYKLSPDLYDLVAVPAPTPSDSDALSLAYRVDVPNPTAVSGKAHSDPLVWDEVVYQHGPGATITGHGIPADLGYERFTVPNPGGGERYVRPDLWTSIALHGVVFLVEAVPFYFWDVNLSGIPVNHPGPNLPYETWESRRVFTTVTFDDGAAGWFDFVDVH